MRVTLEKGRKARSGLLGVLAAVLLTMAVFGAHPTTLWSQNAPGGDRWGAVRPWDELFSVTVAASGNWFAVGKNGLLLSSADGGRTWVRRHLAKRGDLSWFDLYSVRFARGGESGWIAGENGMVLHTVDGGKTWTQQKSGVSERIFRIAPIDSRKAVGAGADGTLIWTDDGNRWRAQSFKGGISFFDIAVGDDRSAWAVGEFATVIHSTDAGRTWVLQQGGDRSKFRAPGYLHVLFRDAQRGWVAGQGGTVVYTADGGNTWQPVSSPIQIPIYGGILQSYGGEETIWFVGDEGGLFTIAATANGGRLTTSLRPTFASLVDIAFAGPTGIAVGGDGTILRSDNGGKSWRPVEFK